jgi:hypothetical protein
LNDEEILEQEAEELLCSPGDAIIAAPVYVLPKQQLVNDVVALHLFLGVNEPQRIRYRSKHVQVVRYGFGDVSGSGFGSTLEIS